MTEFIRKRAANAKNDILSGITVSLALVPEAVAFAFVAGVDPLVGLYAAFMIGLITSIFGGRPGMISGATGALAVVMVSLVAEGNAMGEASEQLGLYYLFATVILMGVIQMLAGVLKLGKFVRLIENEDLWKNISISEPQAYLPLNEDFADKLLVNYCVCVYVLYGSIFWTFHE